MSMLLTSQQAEIVALANNHTPSEFVLVEAAAGTGKTTTIKNFVISRKQCHPEYESMLYVVFNKEAREEAKQSDILRNAHVDILTCNALTMKWWQQNYLTTENNESKETKETKETKERSEKNKRKQRSKEQQKKRKQIRHRGL